MAERYPDRPFPAEDDRGRGTDPYASGRGESDPLAELARLIGQTDPFGAMGRANQQVPLRPAAQEPYQDPAEPEVTAPPGPPPWLQRANRQEIPQAPEPPLDYPSSVHPLQRYARPAPEPEPDYQDAPLYADESEPESVPDPSRYDDALYGQADGGAQPFQVDPAYADDAYSYQDGYDDGAEEQVRKRGGGMVAVAVILALAVVGTGAAFAYRTYVGAPRSGEPPIIKADTSPTKIVPAPTDGSAKVPDRMASNDGAEKIVPREEAPVDVNARTAPRVVPLSQNSNPPPAASVAPNQPLASNGTLPNAEPRKIKTLSVRGDQADGSAVPVNTPPVSGAKQPPAPRAAAVPPPATPRNPPTSANASANAPLSLVPQGSQQPAPAAEPRTRVANTTPAAVAPSAGAGSGGYLVQVSSQKNEADAQASYRALQGKFPGVLGSHAPVIKRADLGDKGVYYRAMVGPFGSPEEASQFCGSLKSAGGQCVVQRN